jgi:ferric-dicitrate binding protein FerR (iron transport regulator)
MNFGLSISRLVLFGFFSFFTQMAMADANNAADSFQVKKMRGEAKYEGSAIVQGAHLKSGGVLIVSEKNGSQVDLEFSEGHHMRLKQGSQMQIDLSQVHRRVLHLLSGQLFVHAAKLKADSSLQIHTKTAVAGVRGTEFLIQSEGKGTYVCVCEGTVEVTKTGDDQLKRLVSVGQDIWSRPDKPLGEAKNSSDMSKATLKEFADLGN